MKIPQKSMEQELKSQEKELTEEINSLGKKVGPAMCLLVPSLLMPRTPKSKFLEKQFNDAQAQLRDIVSDTLDLDTVVLILPKFHHSSRQ